MKKSHILIIIVSAAVAAIMVSFFTSNVTSSNFTEAKARAGNDVKITGTFDKTKGLLYDAETDANLTVFNLIDNLGNSEQVHLHYSKGKPMGLDQSETVTLHGSYTDDGSFHAHDLQLKCPSKYNESQHVLASGNKE
ncbi:MAG: cytochrome c maturation protein CcmE [Flavobacteriales bacterium]